MTDMSIPIAKFYKYKTYTAIHIPREVTEEIGIDIDHNEQVVVQYDKKKKEITIKRLKDVMK